MPGHPRTVQRSRALFVAVALSLVVAVALNAQPVTAPTSRAYTAGKTIVRITSPIATELWVSSVESAPVNTSRLGATPSRPPVIGREPLDAVEPREIIITASPIELASVAREAWAAGRGVSGQIITADYDFKARGQLDFTDAVVAGLEIPTLDVDARTGGEGMLWLRPRSERSIILHGDNSIAPLTLPKQKKWLPSNFRLTIDGLDAACKHVNKIEAITIKQRGVDAPLPTRRVSSAALSTSAGSPLVFMLPESDVKGFEDWLLASVRGVKAGTRKTATLELLSPDEKTVLATFKGVDASIVAIKAAPLSVGESMRRAKVELLVENWQIGSGTSP